jgi:mono/diheme cytochrome c family protein
VKKSIALVVVALAVAVTAAGCGTGGISKGGDTSRGAQVFTTVQTSGSGKGYACSTCHTLQAANAGGKIGPNLDDAFAADRKDGFKQETIQQVVLDQIRLAACVQPPLSSGRCMPRNMISGTDAEAVAAYVAQVAGNPAAAPASGGKITATSGKDVFAAAGCSSCHTFKPAGSSGTVGPDLDQLAAEAKRAGQPLDSFTRESIVKPDAYIEPGYPKGVMPADFSTKLSSAQIDALVTFLTTGK